jgi:hypothetical protein
MLGKIWRAGLQQLSTSSSAEAADWLNSGLSTAMLLSTALLLGQACDGMTPAAAQTHAVTVLNDGNAAQFTQQQVEQLVAEILQPAVDAAAAAAASGQGSLVTMQPLWQAAAHVVVLGHASISAPLMQSLLQLQLQLEPELLFTTDASALLDGGMNMSKVLRIWGAAVGAVADVQQLHASLGWLAEAGSSTRSLCKIALLLGAFPSAVQTKQPDKHSALRAARDRAIAAHGGDSSISISARSRFVAEVLQAAQHGVDYSGLLLSREGAELVNFAAQHSTEVDMQQLLPPDVCNAMLQRLLTACHKASAPTGAMALHLLQQASDQQLQQLPVSLLNKTAQQLLYASPAQLVKSSTAAALLLKVLAAAVQSTAEDSVAEAASSAQLQAELLLQAVRGKLPESGGTSHAAAAAAAMTAAVVQPASGLSKESRTASKMQQSAQQLELSGFSGKEKATKKQHSAAQRAESIPQDPPVIKLQFSQLLSWLQQLGHGSEGPAAAAAAAMLQEMLQRSALYKLPRKQSRQLYELLQELQQQPSWQQQGLSGLSLAACDALLQQQREPAWYSTGAANVLQLLHHARSRDISTPAAAAEAAAAEKQAVRSVPVDVYDSLRYDSQVVVMSALVRLGRHVEAVQLLQQAAQGLAQLPTLVSFWAAQHQQSLQKGAAAEATMSFSDDEGEQQQQSASKLAARVRGTAVTLAVLQQALAVSLQHSQLQLSGQVVQLMQQVAPPDCSVPELLVDGQLEQYLQQLCQDSGSSSRGSFVTARQLVEASLSSTAGVQFSVKTVCMYAIAAAGSAQVASQAATTQQLLQMADSSALLQAALQLASQQEAPALQLLLTALLDACSSGQVHQDRILQQLSEANLQQLLPVLCRSTAGMTVAERLVSLWLVAGRHLPLPSAVTFLDGCGQFSARLQPPAAAVALGLVQQAQLDAAAAAVAGSSPQHASHDNAHAGVDAVSNTATVIAGTQLVANICQQLCHPAAAADVDADSADFDSSWVRRLSSPAAAVALFSCWAWQQQQQQQLLGASSSADLLLQLYHASRPAGASKPRLSGLLLDLGLAAAGRAAGWQEGEEPGLVKGLQHHMCRPALQQQLACSPRRSAACVCSWSWLYSVLQVVVEHWLTNGLLLLLCRFGSCVQCSHHPGRWQEQQQQWQQAGVGATAVRGACCTAACAAA